MTCKRRRTAGVIQSPDRLAKAEAAAYAERTEPYPSPSCCSRSDSSSEVAGATEPARKLQLQLQRELSERNSYYQFAYASKIVRQDQKGITVTIGLKIYKFRKDGDRRTAIVPPNNLKWLLSLFHDEGITNKEFEHDKKRFHSTRRCSPDRTSG